MNHLLFFSVIFSYLQKYQDNKFVEIIDYISEEEECEIIQCDGGKLFERESNSKMGNKHC